MDKRFDRLPVLMRNAIITLKQMHNTPDALAMPAVLGVANLAAIPHYRINTQLFGNIPLSLFILCMVPTGMRKTTNYREVGVGIERFEQARETLMDDDQTRFSIEDAIYKKLLKTYEKEMMDIQTGLTVQTPGMRQPVKPVRPRPVETYTYRLSKATLNGVLDQLRTQPFLGLFSSEAGEMFNSHAFQGGRNDISKSIEMTAGLTNMWDGNELVRQTGQTDSNLRLRNRAVNMMFFLQEGTVRAVLNNPLFSEQGFVHRLLITQAESQPDAGITDVEEYFRQRELQKQSLEPFHERIQDIISGSIRRLEDRPFELDPMILEMTRRAREIMVEYRNQNRNRAREDLQHYAGFAERLTEQMLRIAGTLAVFDQRGQIDDNSMLAACDLMDYFCEQRRNLEVGITSRNPDLVSAAEKLLNWMQQKSFTGTKTEIRRYVRWFRDLTVDEQDKILEDLLLTEEIVIREMVSKNGKMLRHFSPADPELATPSQTTE